MYFCTKFRQNISIYGSDITTSGFDTNDRHFSNSTTGFRFDQCVVIGMSFCICLPNLKFRINQTNVGVVMTSYRFFKMAAIEWEIYFRFRFGDCTHLRRWKCVYIPNLDQISQSTAEIKLLPVSD